MQINTASATKTLMQTIEYFSLNSEISVCRIQYSEQEHTEGALVVPTCSTEFFALTSKLTQAITASPGTGSAMKWTEAKLPSTLKVLPNAFVLQATSLTFAEVYFSKESIIQPIKLVDLNKTPFTWLTGLAPSQLAELGLYFMDFGTNQLFGLRPAAPATLDSADSGEVFLPGSLHLPLVPISQRIPFDYMNARMDNGKYDLLEVAQHLFSDSRVDLAMKHKSPKSAILKIPYYNCDEERNRCLEFSLALDQEKFEQLYEQAFGTISLDFSTGALVSTKPTYRTMHRLIDTIVQTDFLGIEQFRKDSD